MKRIALILIVTFVAVAALAEPGRPGRGGRGELLPPQALNEFLDLTEAQIAAVQPLRETLRATLEPLRDQVRENGEFNPAVAQQIKAAHDAFKASFEALLTPEQKAKLAIYDEIKELRRGPRGPRD